jgi:hypothetical protein
MVVEDSRDETNHIESMNVRWLHDLLQCCFVDDQEEELEENLFTSAYFGTTSTKSASHGVNNKRQTIQINWKVKWRNVLNIGLI